MRSLSLVLAVSVAALLACQPERPPATAPDTRQGLSTGAPTDPGTAESLYRAGRFVEARERAVRDLAAVRANPKATRDARLAALETLANVQTRLAAFKDAGELYHEAEALLDPKADADQLPLARLFNARAEFDWAQARWDDALALAKKSLAIRTRLLPADHLDLADSLANVGFMLADMPGATADARRVDTARWHLLRSWTIRRTASPDSAETGEAWNNLGVFFLSHDAGDFSFFADESETELSERCLKKGLDIRRKALPEGHSDIAESLVNLAYYYVVSERWDDADKALREALAILERALGSEHPDVAFTLNVLGELRQHQDRPIEAEALLERSQRIFEKVFGPNHYFVGSPLRNLQTLYNETNQPDKAKAVLKRLDRIRGRDL